jgi:hypothetical protein
MKNRTLATLYAGHPKELANIARLTQADRDYLEWMLNDPVQMERLLRLELENIAERQLQASGRINVGETWFHPSHVEAIAAARLREAAGATDKRDKS